MKLQCSVIEKCDTYSLCSIHGSMGRFGVGGCSIFIINGKDPF